MSVNLAKMLERCRREQWDVADFDWTAAPIALSSEREQELCAYYVNMSYIERLAGALFLALAKRRDDLHLAKSGTKTRKSLDGYNMEMVSSGMNIMAAVTIVSYVMYTVSPEVVAFHSTRRLYLTSFWVIIGILRYLQITYVQSKSGSPTLILLQDPFLIIVVLGWLASIFVMKYALSH